MSTMPYLQRLEQLKSEEAAAQSAASGLPLQRPQAPVQEKEMLGIPQEPEADPMEQAMSSQFGKNLEGFSSQDSRFQEMMQEYIKLANGLREQVSSGYMPQPVAEQKLKDFIADSGKHFKANAAGPMDNPQIKGAIEGIMSQAMQGGGQPQEQMPQGQPMPEGAQPGGM